MPLPVITTQPALLNHPLAQMRGSHSIKKLVRERATGLSIDENVAFDEPKYFLVEVFGGKVQDDGSVEFVADYAGDAKQQVIVRASYRIPIISPFINSIRDSLRLDSSCNDDQRQF